MDDKRLVDLIDLTQLGDNDTETQIAALCQQAQTRLGPVAAICIYPSFLPFAKSELGHSPIQLATVANFPHGKAALMDTLESIEQSVLDGADEIDVVLPYHHLLTNETHHIERFLAQCRKVTNNHTLKVIIESSALSATHIEIATQLVVDSGANFVKTSTGKAAGGATQNAVKIICETLNKQSDCHTGVKISGGVRTRERAELLLSIVANTFGDTWITSNHVRIGASQLLSDILDPA